MRCTVVFKANKRSDKLRRVKAAEKREKMEAKNEEGTEIWEKGGSN